MEASGNPSSSRLFAEVRGIKDPLIFSVLIKNASTFVVSLPLFGLAFSIFWSLIFDFDRSTGTSCKVFNFLPSISAAIALTPQAYVWRVCITLHSLPRYIMIYGYMVWYSRRSYDIRKFLYPLRRVLMLIVAASNFLELTALLILTLVSSRENRNVHETCFVLFMIGGLACMVASCLLYSMIIIDEGNHMKLSLKRKLLFLAVNIASFVAALYCYFRHNSYCEPTVYSWFAFFEYIVVISNVFFHYTIALDFGNYSFAIVPSNDKQN